ncbi:hypothetical protein PRIPAC_82914 [Pristionchus pacificus]|uniref:Uncharacterized protein n=1 Tax=Pristionchus pacificus TaxID=54126 RepID=A0A2A6CK95_PRIPA|nr:hypothetical protein PRIPAC_82914 [Pristionchus pacificus]|eukprot:PDM78451.1 hypothetical protein PRIPAC_31030 [Pristionchus pacificus]
MIMAKLMMNWQIGRFVQAQDAADTVSSDIRGFLGQPGIHTLRPTFTLEKIAGMMAAGSDRLSIISRVDHPLTTPLPEIEDQNVSRDSPITESRYNLIILADSTEAVATVKEPTGWTAITLRIGFLDGQMDKLTQFLSVFDIVIADRGMNLPMRIIEEIVATKKVNR